MTLAIAGLASILRPRGFVHTDEPAVSTSSAIPRASTSLAGKRPLLDLFPTLTTVTPFVELGDFPTPITPLAELADGFANDRARVFVKRDDICSAVYGGNKVRTLESLFGKALHERCTRVVATGAYGSNHAVATVLHAGRVGLASGVLLFPQPGSATARENFRISAAKAGEVSFLPHWSVLPFAMLARRQRARRRAERILLMPPGGANPTGALGYVSAALEVAVQVQSGVAPRPEQVIVAVGSTCTSAGLLLGFSLAARLGIGFVEAGVARPPHLISARVTPWPVTSRARIVALAVRANRLLSLATAGEIPEISRAELSAALSVDGRFLGRGYARSTESGLRARETLKPWGSRALDTTYGAKSAAALLDLVHHSDAPTLYWATKSSVPLPEVMDAELARAPVRARRWLARDADSVSAG